MNSPGDHGLTPGEAATHLMVEDPTDPNTADFVDFAEGCPVPLERETETKDFPFYALPKVLGEFVYALSESTQTGTGLAGVAVLAALSTAVGGYVEVQVKEDYTEPTNLWTVGVAPSGERKSSVVKAASAPLYEVERDLHKEMGPTLSEHAVQRDIAERAAEKAKRDAGNAADPDTRNNLIADAVTLASQAEALKVPAMPRLLGDDVTIEALGSLLADQGGRFALVSAEGGFFSAMAGRYSPNTDFTSVLQAHAGDQIRVDRKGRESEFVENPALTVGIMIQPGVLSDATNNRAFTESGLMARFLYAWPESKVGRRNVDPDPVSKELTKRYRDVLYSLAMGVRESGSTRTLTLSPEARAARLKYAKEVEKELGPGGSLAHMKSWASKVVGAAVRIAGLIHAANKSNDDVIPGDTMDAGILLAKYFSAHASRVFDGLSSGATDRAIARQVLGVIRRHKLDDFTIRDLLSAASRSWLPNTDTAQPVIELLAEFGYLLRVEPKRLPGPGRPPSPRYRAHPSILEPDHGPQYTQNPQKPNSADCADSAEASDPLDAAA